MYFFSLAWLRKNCMMVFHYVALQLENVPIFESNAIQVDKNNGDGAVYNDFDYDPVSLLEDAIPSYSQSYNSNVVQHNSSSDEDLVPVEAVEHAILEADKTEPVLYEATTFDHPLFECESLVADDNYMQKVFEIATGQWVNISLSMKTRAAYQMRHRQDWSGADSIYDAWLISCELSRSWFPYRKFIRNYPNWEEYRNGVLKDSDTELAATNASQSSQQVHMIADEVGDSRSYEEDFVKNFFLRPAVKGETDTLTRFQTITTTKNVIIISDDSDGDISVNMKKSNLFKLKQEVTEAIEINDSD